MTVNVGYRNRAGYYVVSSFCFNFLSLTYLGTLYWFNLNVLAQSAFTVFIVLAIAGLVVVVHQFSPTTVSTEVVLV
jgi:hypothetical protein